VIGTFLYGAAVGWAVTYLLLSWRKRQPAATVDERGCWSFPMDTWAQMLAIPVERRERFLAELPGIFRGVWKMQDNYPLATLPGAVWVDDGLGELRPDIINAPSGAGDAFAARPLASGMSAGTAETQSGSGRKPASPTAAPSGGDAHTPPERESGD
jgi:hypothetical protein